MVRIDLRPFENTRLIPDDEKYIRGGRRHEHTERGVVLRLDTTMCEVRPLRPVCRKRHRSPELPVGLTRPEHSPGDMKGALHCRALPESSVAGVAETTPLRKLHTMDERTDGRMDGRTDGRMDGFTHSLTPLPRFSPCSADGSLPLIREENSGLICEDATGAARRGVRFSHLWSCRCRHPRR